MRILAVLMTLAALGLSGYAYVEQAAFVRGLPEKTTVDVKVANLTFSEPELVEAVVPEQPPLLDEKDDEDASAQPVPAMAVPGTAGDGDEKAASSEAAGVVCAMIGPIKEGRLIDVNKPLKEFSLLDKVFVEPVLQEDEFWVSVGPFDRKELAESRLKSLEGRGFEGARVNTDGKSYSVFLKSFPSDIEARDWAQKAGALFSLHHLVITKPQVARDHLVRLIFNDIDEDQKGRVEKLGRLLGEKVIDCPLP